MSQVHSRSRTQQKWVCRVPPFEEDDDISLDDTLEDDPEADINKQDVTADCYNPYYYVSKPVAVREESHDPYKPEFGKVLNKIHISYILYPCNLAESLLGKDCNKSLSLPNFSTPNLYEFPEHVSIEEKNFIQTGDISRIISISIKELPAKIDRVPAFTYVLCMHESKSPTMLSIHVFLQAGTGTSSSKTEDKSLYKKIYWNNYSLFKTILEELQKNPLITNKEIAVILNKIKPDCNLKPKHIEDFTRNEAFSGILTARERKKWGK